MSVVSDDFHAFINKIQGVAEGLWTTITDGLDKVVSAFGANLVADVKAAGPDVLQMIVSAALPVLTGGAPITTALAAVLPLLEKEGIAVAEHVLHGTIAAVAANLPTPNIMVGAVPQPAPNPAPAAQ